jgi:hypothetical protein
MTAATAEAVRPTRWRLSTRQRRVAEIVLVLALAALAVVVLRQQALRQSFSVDESRWIATSRYFWVTFVERDVFGTEWQPSYVVYTHPPVARYILGFGLWLQGWQPEQLNGRYDADRSRQFNRMAGNIPSRELLNAARRVSLLFAVGATMLLYPVGRIVAGPVAGTTAVLLALANPLLSTLWTRALAESILAFFCLSALLFTMRIARSPRGTRVPFGWGFGLGLSIGLATATKLSGALVGAGIGLYVVLRVVVRWWQDRRIGGLGPWFDAVMAAFLAFVLLNPLLYPNPLTGSLLLFEHRRDEMEIQAVGTPRLAVPDDLGARASLMFRRAFLDYGTLDARVGIPLDVLLAAVGLGLLALATWRAIRGRDLPGPPAVLGCCAASVYVVSTANLGFDSSHYVMLPVTFAVVLEGVALAAAVNGAIVLWQRWRTRRSGDAGAA